MLRPADLRQAAGIVKSGLATYGWSTWDEVWSAYKSDVWEYWWLHLGSLAFFLVWLVSLPWLKTQLAIVGKAAVRSTQSRILPTLQAMLLSVLIASIWPAWVCHLSWRLAAPWDSSEFAKAVALGLWQVAEWWLPLELIRQSCRSGGLAEAHFGCPSGSVRVLRRHLRWFVPAGLPLVFITAMMDAQGVERWQNALGRLSFLAELMLVIVLSHLVLQPSGSLFRHLLAEGRSKPFCRFRFALYWAGILVPLCLMVVTAVGYFYTARELFGRLRETVFLLLILTLLSAVLSRWILVIRRRLAIEGLYRQQTPTRDAAPAREEVVAGLPTKAAETRPDLPRISLQTGRLVNGFLVVAGILGIWLIWVQVFPAFTMLDEVKLWSTMVKATETVVSMDGSTTTHTVDRLEPVTVADIGLAILIFVLTVIAARNAGGFLQIAIPRQLPLEAGARYAIATQTSRNTRIGALGYSMRRNTGVSGRREGHPLPGHVVGRSGHVRDVLL